MKAIFTPEGHRYHDTKGNEYISVSALIERYGYSNMEMIRRIHGDEFMDEKSALGTEIHDKTVEDEDDRMVECSDEAQPYIIGWRQFMEDKRPKWLAREENLCSPVSGIAGRPDRIEDCGKWLNVPDIKSGCVTAAEKIQTALYAILVEEHYGKPVKDRYSIHLKPFGYSIVHHKDKEDIVIARCLIKLFNDQKRKGLFRWASN